MKSIVHLNALNSKRNLQIFFFEIRDSYDIETMNITVPYNSNKYQKKLNAINKVMFVAKYLNEGWIPDFNYENRSNKWAFCLCKNQVTIEYVSHCCSHIAYFASEEIAEQVLKILGEETIKQALSNDF